MRRERGGLPWDVSAEKSSQASGQPECTIEEGEGH